jgi:hypothetical protein
VEPKAARRAHASAEEGSEQLLGVKVLAGGRAEAAAEAGGLRLRRLAALRCGGEAVLVAEAVEGCALLRVGWAGVRGGE